MKKLKNYGLWVSLFALIGLLLSDLGKMPSNYDQYVQILLYMLVAAGVISNPDNGKWYVDKPKVEDVEKSEKDK